MSTRCPTCTRTGRCNPNAGRGQGRDCAASQEATRSVYAYIWSVVCRLESIAFLLIVAAFGAIAFGGK